MPLHVAAGVPRPDRPIRLVRTRPAIIAGEESLTDPRLERWPPQLSVRHNRSRPAAAVCSGLGPLAPSIKARPSCVTAPIPTAATHLGRVLWTISVVMCGPGLDLPHGRGREQSPPQPAWPRPSLPSTIITSSQSWRFASPCFRTSHHIHACAQVRGELSAVQQRVAHTLGSYEAQSCGDEARERELSIADLGDAARARAEIIVRSLGDAARWLPKSSPARIGLGRPIPLVTRSSLPDRSSLIPPPRPPSPITILTQ